MANIRETLIATVLVASGLYMSVFADPPPNPPQCQLLQGLKVDQIASTSARLTWFLNSCKLGPKGDFPWYEIHLSTKAANGVNTWTNSTLTYTTTPPRYYLSELQPFTTYSVSMLAHCVGGVVGKEDCFPVSEVLSFNTTK